MIIGKLEPDTALEPVQADSASNRMGRLMVAAEQFAKSQIIPQNFRNKPADVFVALEWGSELGMQPMAALQNIYVVSGRPTLSAQSMAGLVKGRFDYCGMTVEANATKARVSIKRKLPNGGIEENIGEFTIEQARGANLAGKDNWKAYPQQMLEARAIAFAIRKAYPDVMAGIYTKEEVEDFGPERNVTKEATATIDPAPKADFDSLTTRLTAIAKNVIVTPEEVEFLRAEYKEIRKDDPYHLRLTELVEAWEKVVTERSAKGGDGDTSLV